MQLSRPVHVRIQASNALYTEPLSCSEDLAVGPVCALVPQLCPGARCHSYFVKKRCALTCANEAGRHCEYHSLLLTQLYPDSQHDNPVHPLPPHCAHADKQPDGCFC